MMRGGKRKGAGRPKGIIKKQQCIYLYINLVNKAEALAKNNKVTKNKIYEMAIEKFLGL